MDALVIALSLVVLTLGAEALVRGASAVALRAGLSPLFVGLTIVGFGTSTPELGASVVASLQGASGVAVGNVIGSNIFNVAVILGITAMIAPIRVRLAAVRRDLVVGIAAACTPFAALLFANALPMWFGYLLMAALGIYLVAAYRIARRSTAPDEALAVEEVTSTLGIDTRKRRFLERLDVNLLLIVVGLVLLLLASRWFVSAAIRLASAMGVSELIIGLTVVSAGTSLPELVTSVVAARRGNADIAIGNVLGSNIFNLLGILGVASALRAQSVPSPLLLVDVPVMLLLMLALLPIMKTGGAISRREGAALLGGYALYLGALIVRAH